MVNGCSTAALFPSPSTFRHGSTIRQTQGPQATNQAQGTANSGITGGEMEPGPDMIWGAFAGVAKSGQRNSLWVRAYPRLDGLRGKAKPTRMRARDPRCQWVDRLRARSGVRRLRPRPYGDTPGRAGRFLAGTGAVLAGIGGGCLVAERVRVAPKSSDAPGGTDTVCKHGRG